MPLETYSTDFPSMVSKTHLELAGHLLFFCLTILFSLAPILINGYTASPGDDAQRLAAAGLEHKRYLGHLIGVYIIPMHWYFFLTPSIVYPGLAVLLKKAAPFTWILLFIVTLPILNHLSAGSHVPVVNFYLIGSLTLTAFTNKKYLLGSTLLIVALMFHTSTGVFILLGVTTYLLIARQYKKVLYTLPTWAIGGLIALFVDLRQLVNIGQSNTFPLKEISILPENVFGSITSDMLPGIAAAVLVALVVIMIFSIVMRDKKSPRSILLKPEIHILLSLGLILTILSLIPHETLSDRATNALLGVTMMLVGLILFEIATTKIRLLSSFVVLTAMIAITAPGNIKFWMESGSYNG